MRYLNNPLLPLALLAVAFLCIGALAPRHPVPQDQQLDPRLYGKRDPINSVVCYKDTPASPYISCVYIPTGARIHEGPARNDTPRPPLHSASAILKD